MLESITQALKGLKRVAGDDVIEFYCKPEYYDVIPHPRPAAKHIPAWFKAIKPVSENSRDAYGAKGFTAKKCMPLMDAMMAGWIIPLVGDVNIRTNEDLTMIEASPNAFLGTLVDGHPLPQLGGKTSPSFPLEAIKFNNPWVVKTAAGVSSFFMPPVNHFEKRFTCFSGLVDTDEYPKQVNFPAMWHLADFDDLLTAGTPLVTVIPVHRADLEHQAPIRKMTPEEQKEIETIAKQQASRRGVYSQELRESRK